MRNFRVIFLVVSLFGIVGVCSGQDDTEVATDGLEVQAQLEINRTTLVAAGGSDKNRVNAAVLMLLSKESAARQVLLEALEDSNNPAARVAVCKALRQSRAWDESVSNEKEFAELLLKMLGSENEGEGAAAAEAMLIYKYTFIGPKINQIIADTNATLKKRLGALYALRIRPDKDAIIEMVKLVDGGDKEIAGAAEKGLEKILGVPAGVDKAEWKRIAKELKRKSRDEFIADRLVIQYGKVNRLEQELDGLQKLYMSLLAKFYETIDEAGRTDFIVGQLGSDKVAVRLWGIEKVVEWKNSGKAVPDNIGIKLISLVGDDDRTVRLKVAKLLAGMSKTGPAEKLLEQIKVEQDREVKAEQIKALGEAVYFALSPGAAVKVSQELRVEVLDIAAEYLNCQDNSEIGVGAKVIRKLLERGGLDDEIAFGYLVKIANKYRAVKADDAKSSAELIDVMNKLCGEASFYRIEAARQYKEIFMAGLSDSSNSVRQFSVSGLENINKTAALAVFREKKTMDDQSNVIRHRVIALAEQVGGAEDMDWLVGKINSNGDSKLAWKAIISILDRSGADLVVQWADKLKSANIKPEQLESVLVIAEKKAASEKKNGLLLDIYSELAEIYSDSGQYDKALQYYDKSLKRVAEQPGKDKITALMADVYIKTEQFGKVGEIVADKLSSGDISSGDVFVDKIDRYLADSEVKADKKTIFIAVLSSIEAQNRPEWQKILGKWRVLAGVKEGAGV